jgi:N-acetyl-beta-hexosaminidase
MPNDTLEQNIKDLESQGAKLIIASEKAGAGFAELTYATMNLTQAIMWLKKGIE